MWMSPLDRPELEQLFQGPVDLDEIFSEALALWDACRGLSIEDQTLQYFTRLYLENDILTKIDRASMLNSLEVRSPFLDINLINFARKIPSEYKIRHGETKYLLKKAVAPMLPAEILKRSKQGFAVPIAKWFKEACLSVSTVPRLPGLSVNFVHHAQSLHRDGKANFHNFLWSYLVLEAHDG